MVGITREKSVPKSCKAVEVITSVFYRRPELPLIRQRGITGNVHFVRDTVSKLVMFCLTAVVRGTVSIKLVSFCNFF